MIGLCVAMLGACFDGTIVGTIGTKLAEDLGGLSLYAWMTTAYLLCETIMIPIAGKLSAGSLCSSSVSGSSLSAPCAPVCPPTWRCSSSAVPSRESAEVS